LVGGAASDGGAAPRHGPPTAQSRVLVHRVRRGAGPHRGCNRAVETLVCPVALAGAGVRLCRSADVRPGAGAGCRQGVPLLPVLRFTYGQVVCLLSPLSPWGRGEEEKKRSTSLLRVAVGSWRVPRPAGRARRCRRDLFASVPRPLLCSQGSPAAFAR